MALISIEQLQLDSRLAGINLQLEQGELLGVIGPNGAGKSSLLECLAGLQPYSGLIELEGKNLKQVTGPEARSTHIAVATALSECLGTEGCGCDCSGAPTLGG